jgi:hypothetical protein
MDNLAKWLALPALVLLGACAAPAGSPYAKPYALFQVDDRMQAPETRPAWVTRIDGRDVIFGRNDPVEPGMREVELSLSGPPGSNSTSANRATLTVDTLPCTRYFFGSKRSSLAASDWKPIVTATEPIRECRSAFGLQ